jgi:hypothetical protein
MTTSQEAPATPELMPKADALAKIAKLSAAVNLQLTAVAALKKAAEKSDRYVLNFQLNSLKKEANFWKAQANRIKKASKTEINWAKEFKA